MFTAILARLYDRLPVYSEEGGVATAVARVDLCQQLSAAGHEPVDTITGVVGVVEVLLVRLGVLDTEHLARGDWRFVSFPAALAARSVLASLADDRQQGFAPGFWLDDQAEPIKADQRALLHTLETQRVRHHADGTAQPIRFVQVAWGLLRLEGRILLHHREDRHRPELPNYVPLGGRLHPLDIGPDRPAVLAALGDPDAPAITTALLRTLVREVEEETGLLPERDYTFAHWLDLAPYRQIEGAGNRHAYTEYRCTLFTLQLTQAGFFRLHERLATSGELTWFTLPELAAGRRADGQQAYVHALQAHFGHDAAKLTAALNELPESYGNTWRSAAPSEAIDFNVTPTGWRRGTTGSETHLDPGLSAADCRLLFALAWQGKGLSWSEIAPGVTPLPYGWISLTTEAEAVRMALLKLAAGLAVQGLPLIEMDQECRFRVALTPGNIHFAEALFSVALREEGLENVLRLSLPKQATPLGTTTPLECRVTLSDGLFQGLQAVHKGTVYQHERENLLRQERRDVEPPLQALGLRKLLRVDRNRYRLTVGPAMDEKPGDG